MIFSSEKKQKMKLHTVILELTKQLDKALKRVAVMNQSLIALGLYDKLCYLGNFQFYPRFLTSFRAICM